MVEIAPRRPSQDIPPGTHGLWSLWDMLELKAGAFMEVATNIAGTAAWVGATSVDHPIDNRGTFHKDTRLDVPDRSYVESRLNRLPEHLSVLGAEVTEVCVLEGKDKISREWATWGTARQVLDDVANTLKRELSLKTVLVLQSEELSYYTPKVPLFGEHYADKFKTAGAFELDEAAKCIALSRPTAAVFHLMRILEVGIKALSLCLNIPDPAKPAERNWAIILQKIKKEGIEKKWPNSSDRMSGDGLLFESLHASLDAVKNPWRNEAMHVTGKYTDDEAKHIFIAVAGFMKKLSARMDENGLPKA